MNDKIEQPKTALELIAAERNEQITKHGRTHEADDCYPNGAALVGAAICYAQYGAGSSDYRRARREDFYIPDSWPWSGKDWRPSVKDEIPHRIKDLTKAAALIVAEIERLQRKHAANEEAIAWL
jgi:hypothetical protein